MEELLAESKNDYIKEFVKDTDKSKVLQAKPVMFKPSVIVPLGGEAKLAIEEMREHGISSVFVIGQNKKLEGLVTIDDILNANKENQPLKHIIISNFHTTDPELILKHSFQLPPRQSIPLRLSMMINS